MLYIAVEHWALGSMHRLACSMQSRPDGAVCIRVKSQLKRAR